MILESLLEMKIGIGLSLVIETFEVPWFLTELSRYGIWEYSLCTCRVQIFRWNGKHEIRPKLGNISERCLFDGVLLVYRNTFAPFL